MEPPSTLPYAEANDQRSPAGQMVDGELRIELEAVESTWYPRGPDGPGVVTPAFAEVDSPPQVPGPLIRAPAGVPVHVTVHNRLDRPIAVRGLLDRASMATDIPPLGPGSFPEFAFAEPLVVPPGETRETRFTPTSEVSSFYYAQTLSPGSGAEDAPQFGTLQEGAFMGALVVDPADSAARQDERVLMITRWNSFTEGPTQKVMANGLSWPFTERLEYTVGDTVRWRVINASNLDHPMHLHGFYFTVDALGDTQADTIYSAGERPLAVTQMLEEFSAMRLTWVPEQPGNWLFHCHLVRHMAFPQRFASEGEPGPAADEAHDGHRMDNMAGLITGVTVHPAAGAEVPEESPVRRIDLWTGERPDVYDGDPELGFVVQEGTEPPAPDSTIVPGSPLVLTRGEPTEIVVHNRLDFPLSVHWHGLELRSVYDGVGGWSGYPGATRPPIPPGDSVRVLITPPRAGSFMYHIHGEPGHELSQGLYGPFLVLEPGEERDADTDRVYTLADRGATGDAAPAINGETRPDPQTFQTGHSYRLRFFQISADAFKRVRLLRDGEPVHWRPLAKDGADLPEAARELGPAALGIGVGETFDVEWQPEMPGVYVLEVTTEFFPAVGGTVVQRVAFGVGDVADSELLRAQQPVVAIDVPSAERARYVGTFVGPQVVGGDEELVLSVWEEQERLYATLLMPVEWDDDGTPERLFPVGDGSLAPGRELEGLRHLFSDRYHFREAADGGLDYLDAEFGGQVVAKLARVPHLELAEPRLRRFEGTYGTAGASGTATVALDDGVLTLAREGRPPERLVPISTTRFAVEGESGMRVDFELDDERAAGLTLVSPTGARTPLPAVAPDTVHVAPPTGEMETDRASILAALEDVEPGGTVQFAPGLYLVGELIPVATPRINLLGHPDGTILRGCNPEAYEKNERESLALESEDPADWWAILNRCGMLELTGGHVTIRDLTFEYSRLGLLLGCCHAEYVFRPAEGGYIIEGSTFRNSGNGIRAILSSSEPTVIRDNDFVNVFHALSADASRVHFLDNHISVPEPERVPATEHPSFAVRIRPVPSGPGDTYIPGANVCEQNVIAGNRVEGHPDGIFIAAFRPGTTCRENTIQVNTIDVQRVRIPVPWIYADDQPIADDADSMVVGIPLGLMNRAAPSGGSGEEREGGRVEDNLVEGNRIIGAEGLGIEVLRASRNRIVNNTITGIARRDPFPGNTLGSPPEWREANGSGVWISPGSNENEIIGNSFSDVAFYDVVVEGDANRVETPAAPDAVRDLGTGNRLTTNAQVEPEPSYESRFVETRGIRLQYADFGGSGLPVIFVQNIHDFSLQEQPESAWLSRLADEFRVLAPMRRGYGESDDPGSGYDVATQAEDLLGLMDALGIRRTVLVGGPPAPQEMTWIAEHHPERLAGLVFLANPHIEPDFREPEVRAFAENYWRGSCDLGETAVARIGPRAAWRPHFLEDETARIDIPALRFFWSGSILRSMDLRRLDRIARMATSEPACDGEVAAREYFAALAADEERLALLRHALTESDRSAAMDSAMARAFGSKLRTVVAGDLGGLEVEDFVYPHIRRFIEEIAGGETARPASPAAPSRVVHVAPPTGEREAGKEPDAPPHESRFVETRGIRLQYMDFGGSGLPVIFLQDFHNYFDSEDSEWPDFYARFADDYRVLAPIRRGYGESDDTGWGYDVATQSEDLLGFMDALGISRAVLVGRQPANQDMTWLAEHHPERVAALVYMGNPLVFPDLRNPLVRTFEQMTWRSCDLGEESVAIVGPRASWRPDFLHDEEARVNIPALRFVSPWDTRTVSLRVLPRIAQTGVNSSCDDEARREYFAALTADEEQVAAIREAIVEADLFPALDRSMERAFGGNLRTEVDNLPKRDGWTATHDFYEPHMRNFLEEVAGIEEAHTRGGAATGASTSSDTVQVAAPTGEEGTDRVSIRAALERVRPGSTVQFAPGTYLIGGIIRVPTDEITLLGDPDGTVIRGCEPDAFPEPPEAYFACHGFELTGARQTVRNLTFEYTWHGLFVGCCFPSDREAVESGEVGPLRSQPGGHLIEGNTFRYTPNGLRVIGESAEPTIVRDNRFIDVYHAVQINGGAVHVLDNDIGIRNPERVPSTNYPGDAINILPFSSMLDLLHSPAEDHTSCNGNIIARNRIEGYPDGIRILVPDPRTSCRRNDIRDNTIIVGRARWIDIENGPRITDETDSTIVGVPLRLSNWARAGAADGEAAANALIEDNLIEGNHIIGAEGIGIEILHASGNRIVNNTITGLQRREPFPGNTLGGEPERWREANGSGIWLSAGSDGNEIIGNIFQDIAARAVVIEGDSNRVEVRSPTEGVHDLGSGNRISGPVGSSEDVERDDDP